MASLNIDFTSFSYDEIKESLKQSLKEDGIITDFDYEGSNTDTIINIMSYITTLINHNINYMSNEAFLNTSRNRKNILKHAQALNYKVERKVSAKIKGTVSVPLTSKRQLLLPKHTSFLTEDGTQFLTTEDYTFTNSSDISMTLYKDIVLKEGTLISPVKDTSLSFFYDSSLHKNFLLEYIDVENSSLTLSINDNIRVLNESTNIMDDILLKNDVFMVELDPETQYCRIKILERYGISPNKGDKVDISFLVSKGAKGNNYKSVFDIILKDKSTNHNITNTNDIIVKFNTVGLSYGGADEETDDEIITYAPLAKSTGNRFITALDWNAGLVNLPQVKASNVWGGDEIGNDILLGFSAAEQLTSEYTRTSSLVQSLKKPGVVYMTGVPSNGEYYFDENTILEIKDILRNSSVISLKKKFLQPINISIDLNVTISKEETSQVTDEQLFIKITDIINNYFSNQLNINYKKAKLANEIYSVDGVDSVSLEGTKFNLEICGYNLYDDSEDYLDISLPLCRTNEPINLTKISSSEEHLYSMSLVNIPDGIIEVNEYVYNPYLDDFLDHIGIQPINYFEYNPARVYSVGSYIMFPNRETGKLYTAIINVPIAEEPSGTTADNGFWKYVEITSNYMDKYGTPVDFSSYKRVRLSHTQGTEYVKLSNDISDYYDENELIWVFNPITNDIEYHVSLISHNTFDPLSNNQYWKKVEINPEIVSEKELLMGVYMMRENMIRINNAKPIKLVQTISSSDIFTTNADYISSTERGICTYYNKGDIINVNSQPYICRHNLDIAKWNSEATYNTDDIVFSDSVFWISKIDSNESTLALPDWETIPNYSVSTTYNIGDLCVYDSNVYKCKGSYITGKICSITKLWDKLKKNTSPEEDIQYGIWYKYDNKIKYNAGIYAPKGSSIPLNTNKRVFYFDDTVSFSNFNTDNMKFKRESRCIPKNISLFYM